MIAPQKINFIIQLVNSTQEILVALEKASKQGDPEKFESVKKELSKLINEVEREIKNLK